MPAYVAREELKPSDFTASEFREFCGPEFNYIWPQSQSLGQHVNSNSHSGNRPLPILETDLQAMT